MKLTKVLLFLTMFCILQTNVLSQHNNLNSDYIQLNGNQDRGLTTTNIIKKQAMDSLSVVESLIIKSISGEQKYKYSYDTKGNLTFELFQKWDGSKWVNFKNWTYIYDVNMITELPKRWEEGRWVNSGKTNFTYDSNKNVISDISQVWSDSQWVNNRKGTYNYNFNGDIIFVLHERWSESQWTYDAHESYLYDLNGHLILYLSESPPFYFRWPYKERYTYNYDSLGYKVSFLSEYVVPQFEQWQNRGYYTYNYDFAGRMSSYIYESWGGNQWRKKTRSRYIYGLNGKITQNLIDSWKEEKWEIIGRVSYTYDINENMTFALAEEWYEDNWITWSYVFDFTDAFRREYHFSGSEINVFYTTITEVKRGDTRISEYSLKQNYPNPFNPTTQLNYQLPKNSFVNIVVYNALGQEVVELVNQHQSTGQYSVTFNASNLPSGVYIYKLQAGDFSSAKKMILTK